MQPLFQQKQIVLHIPADKFGGMVITFNYFVFTVEGSYYFCWNNQMQTCYSNLEYFI